MICKLSELKVGDCAEITELKLDAGAARQMLLALGLIPGLRVSVVCEAPLGDPIVVKLSNSNNVSFRRSDIQTILVRRINESS